MRGPVGSPGSPGAPGTPGTPLIPPAEQPAARAAAIEAVKVHFDPGTLICATPEKDVVELLRDPAGKLSSTAPCVWKVADQVTLRTPGSISAEQLPYNLGLFIRTGTTGISFVGLRYTNRGPFNTIYELEVGHAFPSWGVNLAVVLPLR